MISTKQGEGSSSMHHTTIDIGEPSTMVERVMKPPEKKLRKRRELDAVGAAAALASIQIRRKTSFPSTSDGDDVGQLVNVEEGATWATTSPLSSRRQSAFSGCGGQQSFDKSGWFVRRASAAGSSLAVSVAARRQRRRLVMCRMCYLTSLALGAVAAIVALVSVFFLQWEIQNHARVIHSRLFQGRLSF